MQNVPKRAQQLSVAIPASFTMDIPHLREKTSRSGFVARALAIFRVNEVLIFNDRPDENSRREGRLFQKLLSYQETPQYLRRRLFPQDPDLEYVGILPPLRLPSHPNVERPSIGLVRDALVVETGIESKVEAGLKAPVTVPAKLKTFERITTRISKTEPRLEAEIIDPSRLPIYWGFRVTRSDSTLSNLVRERDSSLIISTSKKGRALRDVQKELTHEWKSSAQTMLLFGSPNQGVPEILEKEGVRIDKACDFNVNMIPDQGVETVRTEEALMATLSILNQLEVC